MVKPLTTKQLLFASKIIEGETQESAYAFAYPSSANKPRSYRDTHASILLSENAKLRKYIESEKAKMAQALSENARRKGIWSREQSLEAAATLVNAALMDIENAKRRLKDCPKSRERIVAQSTTAAITNGVHLLMELMGDDKAAENTTLAEQLIRLSVVDMTENPEDYEAPIPASVKRNKD